jgi:hypothetical protein
MTSEMPAFEAAAARVRRLHDERATLLEQLLAAEDELIRQAAAARHAGTLDPWGLLDAYDLVREGGITGFAARWRKIIPYDRHALRRMAAATPKNPDGTWSGDTGWDGLDGSVIPLRGTYVVYVLFGAGGTPVRIGMTQAFRAHMKRLYRDGVVWRSWKAWPCESRQDALETRKRVAAQYDKPNVAIK